MKSSTKSSVANISAHTAMCRCQKLGLTYHDQPTTKYFVLLASGHCPYTGDNSHVLREMCWTNKGSFCVQWPQSDLFWLRLYRILEEPWWQQKDLLETRMRRKSMLILIIIFITSVNNLKSGARAKPFWMCGFQCHCESPGRKVVYMVSLQWVCAQLFFSS